MAKLRSNDGLGRFLIRRNGMDKNKLWKMAIDSGLCDRDLGKGKQLVTDYGDATDAVERFADMVAAEERETCAKLIDKIGYSHTAGLSQFVSGEFARAADAIRMRSNA